MFNLYGDKIDERMLTCCFSGYRPTKLPWHYNEEDERCVLLKEKIAAVIHTLYDTGIRHFVCGMALGADTYFCEEVLKIRDEHPDITLEAAIPCETQAATWNEKQRNRYFYLVHQCDTEHLVNTRYSDKCMIERNKYMVNKSSVLIAVFDGQFGGTMQTVTYAKKCGLDIIELRP